MAVRGYSFATERHCQLRDIRRDPLRLVLGEQFCSPADTLTQRH